MIPQNKLGITTKEGLTDAEEQFAKHRAVELFDRGVMSSLRPGSSAALRTIHAKLFGDVYEWAGELRTVETVKGNFSYAPAKTLITALKFIDIMDQNTFDDCIAKYIQANIAHPFLVGTGVALRIWLNHMMYSVTGNVVDYGLIPKESYKLAMEKSSTDATLLSTLFRSALTRDSGRAVYLRGVEASFAYEGYNKFKLL